MAKAKNATTKEVKGVATVHPQNTFSVKQPWISEKSYYMAATGQYVFLVDKNTNKPEIKKAIKAIYNVDPVSINTVTIKRKPSRLGRNFSMGKVYKKAIVTLKSGQKLDIMPS